MVTGQDHHQGLLYEKTKRQLWHASFPSKKGRIDFSFRKAVRKLERYTRHLSHPTVMSGEQVCVSATVCASSSVSTSLDPELMKAYAVDFCGTKI